MARVNHLSLCFVSFFLYVVVCSGSDVLSFHENRNVPSTYCVASSFADNATLQGAIDFCCSQPEVNCAAIQPGGPCFDPNTVFDHASYALNLYYKAHGATRPWCLAKSGELTINNPSHDSCIFP